MTTQLRQRFENYLTLQRFSDKTRKAYIHAVAGLAQFYIPNCLSNLHLKKI